MNSDVGPEEPNDRDANQVQRLLEALYRQRTELGEIATELISLLQAAGVSIPDGPQTRAGDSPPD
jgi:hypothetical protein